MKYLTSINLIVVNLILAICIVALLIGGCVPAGLQPEFHPIAGKSVMFVPEGCRIGDVPAPENGLYIGESKLLEGMRREREAEKRKKQNRT